MVPFSVTPVEAFSNGTLSVECTALLRLLGRLRCQDPSALDRSQGCISQIWGVEILSPKGCVNGVRVRAHALAL